MRKRETEEKIPPVSILLIIVLVVLAVWGIVRYTSEPKTIITSETGESESKNEDGIREKSTDSTMAEVGNLTQKIEQFVISNLGKQFAEVIKNNFTDLDVSFIILDLDNGFEYKYNDKQMNSASVIKLFMAQTVIMESEAGKLTLDDNLKNTLLNLISKSDNDAANSIIDMFDGYDEKTRKVTENHLVNQTVKKYGYKNTRLDRKMYNTTPPGGPTGYQNYTCVSDVAKLYKELFNGTLFKEKENNEFLMNCLKKQERVWKIPAKIKKEYPVVTIANKTGELSLVENDAAIISGEDFNVIFVILTESKTGTTDKNKIYNMMSDFGLRLVKLYQE